MRVRDQRRRTQNLITVCKSDDDENRQGIEIHNLQLQSLKYEIGYFRGVYDSYVHREDKTNYLDQAFSGVPDDSNNIAIMNKFNKMTAEQLNVTPKSELDEMRNFLIQQQKERQELTKKLN